MHALKELQPMMKRRANPLEGWIPQESTSWYIRCWPGVARTCIGKVETVGRTRQGCRSEPWIFLEESETPITVSIESGDPGGSEIPCSHRNACKKTQKQYRCVELSQAGVKARTQLSTLRLGTRGSLAECGVRGRIIFSGPSGPVG